jgi:hypothetical protein
VIEPIFTADESGPEVRPTGYRCYLLNPEGRIAERHDLGVTDDGMAVRGAWTILETSRYDAAELWHLARKIQILEKHPTGADDAGIAPESMRVA